MLEHLLAKHDVLLDEVAAVPCQELELLIDRIGFVLQQTEPVDPGAVHGEEVRVVGFVTGIGGLAVSLGGVGVKDADLDSGFAEGELDRTVVASSALDDRSPGASKRPWLAATGGLTHARGGLNPSVTVAPNSSFPGM